MQDKCQQFRDS